MNLLFEQRPTAITSKLQTQRSNQNDVNNNLSSSSLVLKIKRQTTKQRTDFNSNIFPMSNEDNNSRSTTTNQRLKRPIPNSTTRRPSSPAFNGKQQSTKRSVTIDNNNNDLTSNNDENSSIKRFKQDDSNHSSSTKVDASVETVSIGLATEPDQLGPCEPGTSVVLEGIVWNETDSGVLVVNVTWRGKTYVGTLLDSTKQDWACPRLTCESPTSDYDARNSSKTSRAKRAHAGGNNRCTTSSFQHITLSSTSDDRKLRNNIKSRQSKRLNLNPNDDTSPLISPFQTNSTFFSQTPQLISCPELQCQKKFVSHIALTYHLTNTHKKTENISIPQANTRDEEDVAHILANVADYVRRPSPEQTTLTWPCPQISSNLVLSSSLNNSEQDEIKSPEHFLLHIQDEPNKRTLKISTPPPSSFVPINPTIQPPPTSSSPAYSDISDEDPTTMNENGESSPSTINLLTAKIDETTQIFLQQYGSYIQQQGLMNKDLTSNRLNSKPTPNGTSDSTVKNLLDSRRLSTTKPSSPSSPLTLPSDSNVLINDYQKSLFHYHTNGDSKMIKPNENLLHPSAPNPLDYSLNNTSSSSR